MKFMQLRKKKKDRMQAWLELVRFSELFSVPGDFWAGAALTAVFAGAAPSLFRLILGGLGVVLLYAFGAVYNDFCDQSDDHFRKPERPIPSRRIQPGEAVVCAVGCLAAGLVLLACCGRRALICAVVLALLTGAYNGFLKRRIEARVVSMGLCRGLCFLTGCSVVGWHFGCLPVFLALTCYMGFLTWIADGEERHQIPEKVVFYPAAVLAAGWILALPFLMFAEHLSSRLLGYSSLALLVSCGIVIYAAVQVYNRSVTSREMRKYIGCLLLALMPWQASWIFLAGVYRPVVMVVLGVCVLLLFPFLKVLSVRLSSVR